MVVVSDSTGVVAYRLTDAFMKAFQDKTFSTKDVENMNVLERVSIQELVSPLFAGVVASVGEEKTKEKRGGGLDKQLECLSETLEDYGQASWQWTQWSRAMQKTVRNGSKEAVEKIMASEPSRYESLVLREQIRETESKIKSFAGVKMAESYLASEADYAE